MHNVCVLTVLRTASPLLGCPILPGSSLQLGVGVGGWGLFLFDPAAIAGLQTVPHADSQVNV
jgi:hypothetical protein